MVQKLGREEACGGGEATPGVGEASPILGTENAPNEEVSAWANIDHYPRHWTTTVLEALTSPVAGAVALHSSSPCPPCHNVAGRHF